ncbi:TlpA family protein disulfide reductase [Bradyrhizobium sp. 61]|nr:MULTISPECIES: TlpA disulfide reductase family protein [unclassified Bradyrhizobium]MCK1277374.1 TlpA family protein disulfide reductase [Bradyrhizobium sp. 61]MCK1440958.1 TlpA family protein disulfide reductase [Bradyrhizobium sp. 48]MCK1465602.1 TlpA family protein disulfide reductase [Bradyrhizobium sp. 2]
MIAGVRWPSVVIATAASAVLLVVLGGAWAAAEEHRGNLVLHSSPRPLTAIQFEDERGQTRSLIDFKDRVIVLNIWATWCVPCRREMPALDRLQAQLGGPDFQVVPVSIDRGGIDTIRKFYDETAVQKLPLYVDKSGQVLRAVGAIGLPTTLVINRDGQEVGRITGPAEWDSAEMVQFLQPLIAEPRETNSIAGKRESLVVETGKSASGPLQRWLGWLRALLSR